MTNKPGALGRPLLSRTGLDGFFEHVFGRDDFERRQPDPLPPRRTWEALGTAAARTLMIGDSRYDAHTPLTPPARGQDGALAADKPRRPRPSGHRPVPRLRMTAPSPRPPTSALPAVAAACRAGLALWLVLAAWPVRGATVDLVVKGSDGRPLAGAVVYLGSDSARAAARPAEGVQITQQDKRFVPEVSVVPVGTSVHFPNLDRVRHHVYSLSPTRPFELKLYAGMPANPVTFDRPGVAVLGCNIHDNMVAWVVVVETPHHGRSAADGRVRLDGVPPGAYTLHAWHPALPVGAPAATSALTVGAAGAQTAVALPVKDIPQ